MTIIHHFSENTSSLMGSSTKNPTYETLATIVRAQRTKNGPIRYMQKLYVDSVQSRQHMTREGLQIPSSANSFSKILIILDWALCAQSIVVGFWAQDRQTLYFRSILSLGAKQLNVFISIGHWQLRRRPGVQHQTRGWDDTVTELHVNPEHQSECRARCGF